MNGKSNQAPELKRADTTKIRAAERKYIDAA
jgi:hypothetical protein